MTTDFEAALRAAIRDEVEAALAPTLELLDRLAILFVPSPRPTSHKAPAAPSSGPSVTRAPESPRVRRRSQPDPTAETPPSGQPPSGEGSATRFQDGQRVRYRDGETFREGLVRVIDSARQVVTLQSLFDGGLVERGFSELVPF